jgi:hypothetical protein
MAPYTPQGGTEKSAVPRISPAMLFFYNGLIDDLVKSHIEAARWLSKKFDYKA